MAVCASPNVWGWTVRNNIFVNVTLQAGFGIPNILFYNNTLYESGTGNILVMTIRCGTGTHTATGAQVRNNIIVTPSSFTDYGGVVSIETCTDTVHNYNHVTRLPGFTTLTNVPAGENNINGGDPLFVNVGTNDFHLQASSPDISAAATLTGFSDDFDSVTRTVPWDMGAFEYTSASSRPMFRALVLFLGVIINLAGLGWITGRILYGRALQFLIALTLDGYAHWSVGRYHVFSRTHRQAGVRFVARPKTAPAP